MAASTAKEIALKLFPLITIYKDGTVKRLMGKVYVPPSSPHEHPETCSVTSKDITISDNPAVSARLYLPNLPQKKLPILVYFHGGGFFMESAFSPTFHLYLNRLVSEAQVVAVSVEYRLAPENPLPIAYQDCWAALQWVASHSTIEVGGSNKSPWLLNHGDFDRLYIGGDSAGGNIAHNMAIKAGAESLCGGVKILGAFMSCPYFWGSNPMGTEPVEGFDKSSLHSLWNFAYPSAPGGVDNPMCNPVGEGAPSLATIGCSRLLVWVAGKDELLRDRGVWYCDLVRESGWKGEVELFEMEGEEHCFHVINMGAENAKIVMKRLASFLV